MAIQAKVVLEPAGVEMADAYIRLTDGNVKKNYETGEYFGTAGVAVYKDAASADPDGNSVGRVHVRDLDRIKVTGIDPTGNLMAVAYGALKDRIVELGWESSTEAIEDV